MYLVSIFTKAEVRIVSESVNNGLVHPPSFSLFQGLWKIPVIQGDHRFYVGFLQFVNQVVVILDSWWVLAFFRTVREYSRPGDGETVV